MIPFGSRNMSTHNKIISIHLMLLVLICASESRVTVLQSPQSVDATEGDSVTMNCTYGSGLLPVPVGQVSWSRGALKENATELEEDLQLMGRMERSKSHHFAERRIFIKISDLRQDDSATYFCTVKAMTGELSVGNGTKLKVQRRICGNEFLSPPVAGVLVGKCILTILLILFGVVACLVKPKNPDKGPIMKSTPSKVCKRSLMIYEEP
ncbi:natural cytotoxicity triggering receptor 3-like [Scyliorhinus torazame]|uniref:natural cytotoxicity triggering receptor 3-like n=1 Tax=Scyliorhinus torazame TaxID=75743 RepID=UPI003B596FD0